MKEQWIRWRDDDNYTHELLSASSSYHAAILGSYGAHKEKKDKFTWWCCSFIRHDYQHHAMNKEKCIFSYFIIVILKNIKDVACIIKNEERGGIRYPLHLHLLHSFIFHMKYLFLLKKALHYKKNVAFDITMTTCILSRDPKKCI